MASARRQATTIPASCAPEIDAVNARIYDTLNNGVYKAGFATTQSAYEEAVRPLFDTLDWLEDAALRPALSLRRPDTEADWRLFTTLVRFDRVYHGHFKCNLRRIVDYPHLWAYTRELYQWPSVAETVNFAAHQEPLLSEPSHHQSDRHRAARPRDRFHGAA